MRTRRRSVGAMVVAAGLTTATALAFGLANAQATTARPAAVAAASSGGVTVAYYDQWSVYQNAFYLKDLVSSGEINHIDYLVYDFENIDPSNHQCFEAEKASDPDPGGETDPNAGDGAGDMDADYGKDFPADEAVDGQADSYGSLAGNFHQLQELKAAYPKLRVLLSIGGWTYSKYFSDVAATAASREAFSSSCVDMFLKGDGLPTDADYGVTPAAGSIAGLFDGFDIDWEYPGSQGHTGNITSPNDTADYTALLAQLHGDLSTLSQSTGRPYYLTAALPAGQDKIARIQTNQIAQYLTFGDLMSYDLHTAWNPSGPSTGPTDFQDAVYTDPDEPGSPVSPGTEKYSVSNAVHAWVDGDSAYGIPGGFPAAKLTLGIPFYYRGWTGVPDNGVHGLFQPAANAATGATDSGDVPGIQMYKELQSVVTNPSDTFYDPVAEAAYFYDGSNWWTGESAQSVQAKVDYLHCQGLGGVMVFSLYDLDPGDPALFDDVENDLGSTPASCTGAPTSPPTSPTQTPTQSPTQTPTQTPTQSPTQTPTQSPTGPGTACAAAWTASKAYVSGDEVSYGGDNWTANQWNDDEVPGGPAGAWTGDGPCSG